MGCKLVCLLGAVLTGIALFAQLYFSEEGPAFEINGWGSAQFMVTLLLGFFYHWFYVKKSGEGQVLTVFQKRWMMAVAILFGAFCIIGKSYEAFDEWTLLFGGPDWMALAVVSLIGYIVLFYPVLCMIAEAVFTALPVQKTKNALTGQLFEKHPILLPMAVILLGQLPYLIAFYPGIMSCDVDQQVAMILDGYYFSHHHPPFVTYYYGLFCKYGIMMGNGEAGMFLSVILQSLLAAFAFGFVFYGMKVLKTPYWVRYGALLFFTFLTVWPDFATTMIKDSLYYPPFVIYTVLLVLAVKDPAGFTKKTRNFVGLFFAVLLMVLVRNNGLYSFLLSFPFLLFVLPKKGKAAVVAVTAAILLSVSGFGQLWTKLGVRTYDTLTDTYSVMYQQTARYSKYHGDEVTEEEYEVLNKIFEYDTWAELYEPELSDPVKARMRREGIYSTMTVFADEYFEVWWQQFLKHPATYVQAYLNNCFGYFYPDCKEYKEGLGWYIMWQFTFKLEEFHPVFRESTKALQEFLEKLPEQIRSLPGIGMLYSCGFYTWVTLALAAMVCMKKRWRVLIAFLPALSNILICTASPVNAYVRYALPVFAVAPILIAVVFWCGRMEDTAEIQKGVQAPLK